MSDLDKVFSLSEGAKGMAKKVDDLRKLIGTYQEACAEHDRLASYVTGDVSSMSLTVRRKVGRSGEQSASFNLIDREFDPMSKIVLDRLRQRCADLFEQIQKAKENI